jgi:hypothetical protein
MAASQIKRAGARLARNVNHALATLAAQARERQYGTDPTGCKEPLVSWERVAEFDAFKITVRCDYNLAGNSVDGQRSESEMQ